MDILLYFPESGAFNGLHTPKYPDVHEGHIREEASWLGTGRKLRLLLVHAAGECLLLVHAAGDWSQAAPAARPCNRTVADALLKI